MRDLTAAKLPDLFGVRRGARAQDDAGAELLAILRIGHAHALHVLHFGMAVQELLDFARIDVLAAANQHVFGAAHDVAVAFVIDGGQVPRVHPTGLVNGGPGGGKLSRCATFCAAGWGVVTTSTSARGRNCAIESAMSPVPGGMSTIR